jgi:hypothetical protein
LEGRFGAVECNVFLTHKVLPPITPLVAREIQSGLSYSLTATELSPMTNFRICD